MVECLAFPVLVARESGVRSMRSTLVRRADRIQLSMVDHSGARGLWPDDLHDAAFNLVQVEQRRRRDVLKAAYA